MREERQTYRVEFAGERALPAEIEVFGASTRTRCSLSSLSLGGAGVVLANTRNVPLAGQRVVLRVTLRGANKPLALHATVRHVRAGDEDLHLGLQFVATADRTADGRRDELVRSFVMECQRAALARRSGAAARRTG